MGGMSGLLLWNLVREYVFSAFMGRFFGGCRSELVVAREGIAGLDGMVVAVKVGMSRVYGLVVGRVGITRLHGLVVVAGVGITRLHGLVVARVGISLVYSLVVAM